MKKTVIKTTLNNEDVKETSQQLYKAFFAPSYVHGRLISLRNLNGLRYINRGLRTILGHLRDFTPGG